MVESVSLIADPELAYAELAARLRALDWVWRNESQELPTIPGEPEWVLWGREDSRVTLVYTFNPVVRLRVLAFSGPDAERRLGRVASFLPHLGAADVASLLVSGETEPVLLGLFAARELALAELQPLVQALAGGDDALVVQVARQVAAGMPALDVEALRDSLFGREAVDGDRLGVFARYADASVRRQVMRVAGRVAGEGGPAALGLLLGAGLADPDWEVRASAMLMAGRHGVGEVAAAVAALALPTAGDCGLSARDCRRLERLRAAVLRRLAGDDPSGEPDARHAWDCILGEPRGRFDGLFLLAHALTTPFDPGPEPEPGTLPEAIVRSDLGFVLARSRLPMAWVAPVPCWLGDPDGGGAVPNPLRRVVPGAGFFIARRPLSRSAVEWILAGGGGAAGTADATDHPCTHDGVGWILESLAAIEGLPVGLPSADQWEIAARGPDGRRYPWGNGLGEGADAGLSPWGLERMVGDHPHWTSNRDGAPLVCGGPDPRCDRRRPHRGEGLVRPVVRWRRAG